MLAAGALTAAACLRGAEYDEQYTLFLAAGTPRPVWPKTVFPAGAVAAVQAGQATPAGIARDLRATDVHPAVVFLDHIGVAIGFWPQPDRRPHAVGAVRIGLDLAGGGHRRAVRDPSVGRDATDPWLLRLRLYECHRPRFRRCGDADLRRSGAAAGQAPGAGGHLPGRCVLLQLPCRFRGHRCYRCHGGIPRDPGLHSVSRPGRMVLRRPARCPS